MLIFSCVIWFLAIRYRFIVFRDLVWHSGGYRHLVCHHQRLCHRCYLRLHPSPCLRLQVWTLCWSRSSRGRVSSSSFVLFYNKQDPLGSLVCTLLTGLVCSYFRYCERWIKWFLKCSSGVWWVTSTPVSQYSWCLTLRGHHSLGLLALSCLEKLWSIAGSACVSALLIHGLHYIHSG